MKTLLPALFRRDEEGSASVGGIFFTITALGLTGLALDQANAWQEQTHLQIAADAAAMAAATNVHDFDAARTLGLEVAKRNLGSDALIGQNDFDFGIWDEEAATFTSTADQESANAVRVSVDRRESDGDALPTYLLRFVGIDSWDIGATSIALTEVSDGSGGGGTGPNCNMMTVISYGAVQTGGGNLLKKGVCIHGQMGVATGGGDTYDTEVTFSAPNVEDIYVASYKPNNLPEEDLTMVRNLEPSILPQVNDIWVDLWTELYIGAPETYQGDLLPDFLYTNGAANVVIKEGWWSIQPGEIEENTIYVVNGSAQFAGDLDAQNVAFLVNGDFGTGGGWNLHFEDVYIIGKNIGLAGNVTWGESGTQCKKDYFSVYLLGTESLSMGGWGNSVSVNGVIGVSPDWNPGGNMKARNVYFETGVPGYSDDTDMGDYNETSLGGDLSVNGNDCSFELSSIYDLATRGDMINENGLGRSRLLR